MAIKNIFKSRNKNVYITVHPGINNKSDSSKANIKAGMWTKCDECQNIIYHEDLKENLKVCPKCNHHFRLSPMERIKMHFDSESFREIDKNMKSKNPINFEGYELKINSVGLKTGSKDAVITGTAKINGLECAVGVMDSFFIMGSMGSVVGEKITRMIEKATKENLPVIIFCTSGGARMQEGIFSLMQMAKVSSAIARHKSSGNLYVSILTDPTTGGVTASFAMEGDIIISEPKALIGFAGRRVIESTIKEKLPETFQKAEFLLQKGFIDIIEMRKNIRKILYEILLLHSEEM